MLSVNVNSAKACVSILLAVASLSGVSGCSHLSPLHANTADNRKRSVGLGDGYQLAFIEFGEQGSYQDFSQLQNAIELVKKTPRPLVITYVHGWHNNAGSADVSRFSQWLSELSKTEAIRASGFRLIGIYFGWRGELTTAPIIRQLTFYNRKAAAERLASNFDCFDAIAAISAAARSSHQPREQYTVLIGHSFGGLIIERSVAHAINAEIHGQASMDRALPADLIMMVNPASDSILTRQIFTALYVRHTEDTRPFLVSLTSVGDGATGTIFPLGTSLAATTKAFNNVPVPGYSKTESERRFFTSTPGHNSLLINYETQKQDKTINSRDSNAIEMNLSHNLQGHVFTLDGPAGKLELWKLNRITNVDIPYWDVKVDPSIIRDHGDIWNPRARAMMAAIFRITNPMLNRNVKPRAQLQQPPDLKRMHLPSQ